jgi:uncharacterized protein YpuA (DUF1002 family)
MSSTPATPADRQKLMAALTEITRCMQRADDERSAKKDIVNTIHEEFDIPKKQINKIARTMHKRNYQDVVAEELDFQELYETVIEGKLPTKVV